MSFRDSISPPTGTIVRFNTLDSKLDVLFEEELGSPSQIVVDEVNKHLYWALASPGDTPSVRRSNLDGTNVVTVAGELGNSHGVAVDAGNGHVYYTTRDSSALPDPIITPDGELPNPYGELVPIRRIDADTATAIDLNITNLALAIELDLAEDKMYWADDGSLLDPEFPEDDCLCISTIRRANLDGTDVEILAENEEVGGLALHRESQKLYWASWSNETLSRSDLDGSNTELLVEAERISCCDVLDIHEDRLYWLDADRLYAANLDGTDAVAVADGLPSSDRTASVEGIRVYQPDVGDFDFNGRVDAIDIDFLAEALRAPSTRSDLDLDFSGTTDSIDFQTMITDVVRTAAGDTDLNGTVNFADFLVLSQNFGQPAGWGGGDFDGDGEVQFGDFLLLSQNFGVDASEITAVPEPSGQFPVWFGTLSLLAFGRYSSVKPRLASRPRRNSAP